MVQGPNCHKLFDGYQEKSDKTRTQHDTSLTSY